LSSTTTKRSLVLSSLNPWSVLVAFGSRRSHRHNSNAWSVMRTMIVRITLATFLVASTAQAFSFGLLDKRNDISLSNIIPKVSDEKDCGSRRAFFISSVMTGLLAFTAQPASASIAECETECIYRCTKQIPHNSKNKEVLVEQCRLQCSEALTCDEASKINPNTPAPYLLPGSKAGTSIISLYPTWQDSMGGDDIPSVIQAAPSKIEEEMSPSIKEYMSTRQVWLEELEKL
jgi:hypothetical protein